MTQIDVHMEMLDHLARARACQDKLDRINAQLRAQADELHGSSLAAGQPWQAIYKRLQENHSEWVRLTELRNAHQKETVVYGVVMVALNSRVQPDPVVMHAPKPPQEGSPWPFGQRGGIDPA